LIVLEEEVFDAYEFAAYEDLVDDMLDDVIPELMRLVYQVNGAVVVKLNPDFNLLRP
jgi:hypothetical protein